MKIQENLLALTTFGRFGGILEVIRVLGVLFFIETSSVSR